MPGSNYPSKLRRLRRLYWLFCGITCSGSQGSGAAADPGARPRARSAT